jgi:transglutaminase-like putative cysteine protease
MSTTRSASPPVPGLGLEAAVLASALVGAVAVGRLVRGGWTGPATWPLLATTVTGVVVVAVLARRPRLPAAATATVGVIAVVWVAVGTSVGGATWFGVPQGRAASRIDHALHGVRGVAAGWHWPLAAATGVVLVAALLSGLASVTSRAVLGHPARANEPPSRPAAALLPTLVLVAGSGLARSDGGAVALAVAFVAVAAATLMLGEPDVGVEWGRWPTRPATRRLLIGLLVAGAAVVGGTALGVGSAGSAGGSGAGPTVSPTGLQLATDLVGLEQRDARVVMFRARTPTDTYWQVGQVTVWNGDGWGPDAATLAALSSSTAPTPGAAGGTTIAAGTWQAQVTMAGLVTRLLPAPPDTRSIQPSKAGTITAIGVVAPQPSRPGVQYQTTSAQATTGAARIEAAAGDPAAGLDRATRAQDTLVPIDSSVLRSRARQITAGASSPLEQAEDLVDYFHSGRFRYQVTAPPSLPVGAGDAVLAFLDSTRTGNCETFATAFALLARSLGLPTRVAIGFTGGTRAPDGSTVVRGGDAHAWPQVHLGSAGWVSFEPTPQLPGNQLAPPDVIAATPATSPVTAATTTTAAPTTTRPGSGVAPPSTAPGIATTTTSGPAATVVTAPATTEAGAPVGRTHRSGGWPWWLVSVAVAVAVAIIVGLAAVVWRVAGGARRRRHRATAIPVDPVVAAYDRAVAPLADSRWARRASQSPYAHARQLGVRLVAAGGAGPDPLTAALDDLARLAGLAEAAVYGARPVSADDVDWATAAGARIAAVLSQPASRARLGGSPRSDWPGSGEPALSGARPG